MCFTTAAAAATYLPTLATGGPGLFRGPLVRGSFEVSGTTALAGDLALLLG